MGTFRVLIVGSRQFANYKLLRATLDKLLAEKKLGASALVFTVPAGLRRILDRDMKAAGIPKCDERNRTVDVHAMLSASGTAPRTAQAAMRHSDIKLTMNTYTDPKMLDVRQAVERLPVLNPCEPLEMSANVSPQGVSESAHDCAETGDPQGQNRHPMTRWEQKQSD